MMKIGIIAADEARARFITGETLDDTTLEGSPKMVEHENVVNPLGHVKSGDEFSDSMSRKPSGGGPSGAMPLTDDHRDRHELEEDRRYARRVLEAAEQFVNQQQPARLVLSASPGLLGVLRSELDPRRFGGLGLTELPQDVSNQSLSQIRQVLTQRGSVAGAGVYRPRGQ